MWVCEKFDECLKEVGLVRRITGLDVHVESNHTTLCPDRISAVVGKTHKIGFLLRLLELLKNRPQFVYGAVCTEFEIASLPLEGMLQGLFAQSNEAETQQRGFDSKVHDHAYVFSALGVFILLALGAHEAGS
jgi:hypothetical protein